MEGLGEGVVLGFVVEAGEFWSGWVGEGAEGQVLAGGVGVEVGWVGVWVVAERLEVGGVRGCGSDVVGVVVREIVVRGVSLGLLHGVFGMMAHGQVWGGVHVYIRQGGCAMLTTFPSTQVLKYRRGGSNG